MPDLTGAYAGACPNSCVVPVPMLEQVFAGALERHFESAVRSATGITSAELLAAVFAADVRSAMIES